MPSINRLIVRKSARQFFLMKDIRDANHFLSTCRIDFQLSERKNGFVRDETIQSILHALCSMLYVEYKCNAMHQGWALRIANQRKMNFKTMLILIIIFHLWISPYIRLLTMKLN